MNAVTLIAQPTRVSWNGTGSCRFFFKPTVFLGDPRSHTLKGAGMDSSKVPGCLDLHGWAGAGSSWSIFSFYQESYIELLKGGF